MAFDDRRSRKFNRKRQQLCGQVEKAINLAFGASHDELLQSCWVMDVQPAPNAGCMRVLVQTWEPATPDLQERLQRAVPWLRSEVAGYIYRKKVPLLQVELVPPDLDFRE